MIANTVLEAKDPVRHNWSVSIKDLANESLY